MGNDAKMHSSLGSRRTVLGSISLAGKTLRKQLWLWPLIAAAALAVIGWQVRKAVEQTLRNEMSQSLEAILRTDVAALEFWYRSQQEQVRSVAADRDVRVAAELLLEKAEQESTSAALLQTTELAALREQLEPWINSSEQDDIGAFQGFILISPNHRIVAAERDDLIVLAGSEHDQQDESADARRWIDRALSGETIVTPPFQASVVLQSEQGESRVGLPTMFALTPLVGDDGQAVAVLGLRFRPGDEFTKILSLASAGESGETYAFGRDGLMLSQSRFDADLKKLGLIRDVEEERSILNLEIRDPEVNLTAGLRPSKSRSEQPLTRMAASAVAGERGVDVEGYRDYRGVLVVGAWTWLDEHEIGVASEMDYEEAYHTLSIVRRSFWTLFTLLAASAAAIYVYMLVAARWQRQARSAAVEARRLGQYHLDEKIGAGGMGVVYRAHHAMLQRPTAVKLLNSQKTDAKSIARFEREVQLTSQLNHPNTIAIYDYGRTPEGVFYYAMEYLDGMALDDAVNSYGPMPEGRVIHILRQVCDSLAEAHESGLIHRDVKPANIMINRRGGMFDVVKVLDFGLVKAVDGKRQATITQAGAIAGTPQYLSPEGIETPDQVDARSDIYAIGAVGYYLLTGSSMFDGSSVMDVCMRQINDPPVPLADRLGKPVAADLEQAIMQCLRKDRERRPADVRTLAGALGKCRAANSWTRDDARDWWQAVVDQGATTMAPTRIALPVTKEAGVDETRQEDQDPTI